jgi:hypothetical protein
LTGLRPKNTRIKTEELTNRISAQEQNTAWKSRASEYGPAFRIRQVFFSECYGQPEKTAKFNIPATGRDSQKTAVNALA